MHIHIYTAHIHDILRPTTLANKHTYTQKTQNQSTAYLCAAQQIQKLHDILNPQLINVVVAEILNELEEQHPHPGSELYDCV